MLAWVIDKLRAAWAWASNLFSLRGGNGSAARGECGDQLVIRIDKGAFWASVAIGKAAKDLEPRKGSESKSAWAHLPISTSSHMPPYDELIQGTTAEGAPSNLALHALSMFICIHKRNGPRRDTIDMLSFPCTSIPRDRMENTPGIHVIPDLDRCHRDIRITSEPELQALADSIKRSGPRPTKYSREELRPLYDAVRAKGLLREELAERAEIAFSSRR